MLQENEQGSGENPEDKTEKSYEEERREYLETQLNPEMLELIKGEAEQMREAFENLAVSVAQQGGNMEQWHDNLRDLTNAMFMRTSPGYRNAFDPERVQIALDGARALLAIENVQGRGYSEGAQRMKDALEERFSTIRN